jgi:hypothetical protein
MLSAHWIKYLWLLSELLRAVAVAQQPLDLVVGQQITDDTTAIDITRAQ